MLNSELEKRLIGTRVCC